MDENNASIGANMKKKREDAGVSLRAVARALGYSAPYVLDLESGKRTWSPSTEPNLQEAYTAAFERATTAQELIKKRKAVRVPVEKLAAEMKISTDNLNALEEGRLPWKSGRVDFTELYVSALNKLSSASSYQSEIDAVKDNARDLKIKQLILCVDGCSDDELNEIVSLAESKYLRHITDPEERKFYHETLEKIHRNDQPLNRNFIYD